MIDAPTRQDCVIAGFALAAVLSSLLFLSPATAQIAVTDPPVETSTAATASELLHTNQILSQDVQVNTQNRTVAHDAGRGRGVAERRRIP